MRGLRDDTSRELVHLKSPKTLIKAAHFARFSEAAVRVAKRSTTLSTFTVNKIGQRNTQYTRYNNQRYRSPSSNKGGHSWHTPSGGSQSARYVQSTNKSYRTIINNFKSQAGPGARPEARSAIVKSSATIVKNWGILPVSAVALLLFEAHNIIIFVLITGFRIKSAVADIPTEVDNEEEPTEEGASGFTANTINNIPKTGNKKFPYHDSRKLAGVPGQVNNVKSSRILVDSGSPVTIIRSDLWDKLRSTDELVHKETENFKGLKHDGLHILGITNSNLKFGALQVKHPVLFAKESAHQFILGNDFLTKFDCNVLNSSKVIVFGGECVQYTLFCCTVNSICPVISRCTTTVNAYEEAVILALLDAKTSYATNQSLLLEPRKFERDADLLLKARVLFNYVSPVVPMLVANVTSHNITIP